MFEEVRRNYGPRPANQASRLGELVTLIMTQFSVPAL